MRVHPCVKWRGHVICGGGLKGDLDFLRIIFRGDHNLGQWQETLFAPVRIGLAVACFSFKLVARLQQPMTSQDSNPPGWQVLGSTGSQKHLLRAFSTSVSLTWSRDNRLTFSENPQGEFAQGLVPERARLGQKSWPVFHQVPRL